MRRTWPSDFGERRCLPCFTDQRLIEAFIRFSSSEGHMPAPFIMAKPTGDGTKCETPQRSDPPHTQLAVRGVVAQGDGPSLTAAKTM